MHITTCVLQMERRNGFFFKEIQSKYPGLFEICLVSNPLFLRVLAALEPKADLQKMCSSSDWVDETSFANGFKESKPRSKVESEPEERWIFKGTHVLKETNTCEVDCQVSWEEGMENCIYFETAGKWLIMNWQKCIFPWLALTAW